jgi:NAD(P)-dependent dehydrogenase (short-subunit alcohol dehydrogenase family)
MSRGAAIVTGASRGIGLAIARALRRAGHPVALVARDADRLAAATATVVGGGVPAIAIPADLRDVAAATRILARARAELGPPEVLVNNAGTAPTARFADTTDDLLDEVLDLHVRAPFRLIRAMLPELLEAGRGAIVQVASTAGLRGFAFTAAYTAAKHAMVGMTRALAEELRRTKLRAHAVCPGFVDTAITRAAAAAIAARGRQSADDAFRAMAALNSIGRMHTPDEVADAVVMLVRDRPDGTVYDLDSDPPVFV